MYPAINFIARLQLLCVLWYQINALHLSLLHIPAFLKVFFIVLILNQHTALWLHLASDLDLVELVDDVEVGLLERGLTAALFGAGIDAVVLDTV